MTVGPLRHSVLYSCGEVKVHRATCPWAKELAPVHFEVDFSRRVITLAGREYHLAACNHCRPDRPDRPSGGTVPV